jgi:hypothetical protein
MSRKVRTEKELADAINGGADEIEIEGNLQTKVFKIKAKGKVAWAVAFGAITIAAGATIAAFKVNDAKAKAAAASGAVALGAFAPVLLGPAVAASAIQIAVFAGRVAALNDLRSYRIKENVEGRLVLAKK